jgi:hypothetical protein
VDTLLKTEKTVFEGASTAWTGEFEGGGNRARTRLLRPGSSNVWYNLRQSSNGEDMKKKNSKKKLLCQNL